jgi:hypothetical protein
LQFAIGHVEQVDGSRGLEAEQLGGRIDLLSLAGNSQQLQGLILLPNSPAQMCSRASSCSIMASMSGLRAGARAFGCVENTICSSFSMPAVWTVVSSFSNMRPTGIDVSSLDLLKSRVYVSEIVMGGSPLVQFTLMRSQHRVVAA